MNPRLFSVLTSAAFGNLPSFWRLLFAFALWFGGGIRIDAAEPIEIPAPVMQMDALPEGRLRLEWEAFRPRYVVETASVLNPESWSRWPMPIREVEGRFETVLESGVAESRFFRLRMPLATIASTSPGRGEGGVSVGRETVVRFTASLAENAHVTTTNFYALFAGRRVLSRCEVSANRRQASLFYLEPLPGSARVTVVFDSANLTDELGLPLDGDGDGAPGGMATFWFDTLNLTPVTGTAVIGRVFAAHTVTGLNGHQVNQPLAGVTITVDGREEDLRAVTDANGFFRLQPAPAGRFFVHIDGRTAPASSYPAGAYYPSVGKAWDALAGKTDNLAGGTGEIFLPRIPADALQSVSATEPTLVHFPPSVLVENPALAAAVVTVPPNALFSDHGTRGGRIGLAPVPSDRLPGPLPEGLSLASVFTVQTDGPGNFDQPVPVCLPNIPEVVTGAPLPPGTRRSLVSFDHKKGDWESVGFMVVSADGRELCTVPGAGIRQPGWHGAGPAPFVGPAGGDGFDEGGSGVSGVNGGGIGNSDASGSNGGPGGTAGGGSTPGGGVGPGGGGPGSGNSGGTGSGGPGSGGPGGPNGGGGNQDPQDEDRCRDANLAECLDRGVRERELCQAARTAWQDQAQSACDALAAQMGINDPRVRQCYRELGEGFKRRSRECHAIDQRMDNECAPCEHAPFGSQRTIARMSENSVLDPIVALQDEAMALLEPFLVNGEPIPAAVRARADELQQQAWILAGGDLAAFLSEHILALERELAARFPSYAQHAGDPPNYPIRFVATIARPDGMHYVRGDTGPFGAYQFFVPDDGAVLLVEFFDPKSGRWGSVYPNRRPDALVSAPPVFLNEPEGEAPDEDADGLSDFAEFVVGTSGSNPDTDGDGVPDGTELSRGSDPLDGIPVQTGVLAAVDTPGRAMDIVVDHDLAVVADGTAGIALFDVSNPIRPLMVAQVPTINAARAVAVSARHVVAATGSSGLAILDLTAGLPLTVRQQLDFGSAVLAVAAEGSDAYVILESRELVRVDLFTGVQRDRLKLPGNGPMQDVVIGPGAVYVLTTSELFAVSRVGERLQLETQLAVQGLAPGSLRRKRLSLAEGRLYASHRQGFSVFDVNSPLQPVELAHHVTTQFGWKQLVPVRPGLGVSPGGANSTDGADHDLRVYDLGPNGTNAVFLNSLATPGTAVAAAVWKGLAYVADDANGLQVVNFRSTDVNDGAPTVTLDHPQAPNPSAVMEGQPFEIAAWATDVGLVRTVEFYVEGERVATAGRHPFRGKLTAPLRFNGRSSFTVRARATDLAGNVGWSEARIIQLLADTTPPRVEFTVPADGRFFGPLDWLVLGAVFDEQLEGGTITSETFRLRAAGNDGQLDTTDDVWLPDGIAGYREDVRTAWLAFARPLDSGRYQAVMTRGVRDSAGNALAAELAWQFEIFDADLRTGGFAEVAGRIERQGAFDVLNFHGRAGQQLYFDERSGSCNSGLWWRCVSPSGFIVFDETLGGTGCGLDAGLKSLPEDGGYQIMIRGVGAVTNEWAIGIYDVPIPPEIELSLNASVSDGVPVPGSGSIETPGGLDAYAITVAAGQAVFFEEASGTCASQIRWRCESPSGEVVFDETLGGLSCGRHAGSKLLAEAGIYRITVAGHQDATGPYAFSVWDATPQIFSVTPDAEIRDGQPAAGAGRIETPGAVDRYTFSVPAGTRLRFENSEAANSLTGLDWRLVDEAGDVMFEACLSCTDPGVRLLTRGGTYTLTVGGGTHAGTGTYVLRLSPPGEQP